MQQFSRNRFLDALIKLVIISAVLHISILAIYSLNSGNFAWLNYFRVLSLELFYPQVLEFPQSLLSSAITAASLYFILFFLFTRKGR